MTEQKAIAELKRVLRLRHYKLSTEKTYIHWLKCYMGFVRSLPAGLTSEQKLEKWLSDMAPSVSASTQNQAFNAVLFFYGQVAGQKLEGVNALRAKRRHVEKYCPSVEEVRRILGTVHDRGGYPTRLIIHLLYGCGLRVSEPLNLRIRDVRFDDMHLIVRDPKHGNDRVVHLPSPLVNDLQVQIQKAKLVYEHDRLEELPVQLPDGIDRKYPYAQFDWNWFFVFPLRNPCPHPRSGKMVRYRCLEGTVQRAMRDATNKLKLRGITPHTLRHAYATHTMRNGSALRDIQEALGHRSIETTMTYTHAGADHVPSPLEMVG